MATVGAFSDLDDIKWTWLGKGTRKENSTYYDKAEVMRLSDRKSRIFNIGDTVYVANHEGPAWVAHLVEMYQIGGSPADDDEECQVVEDATAALRRMRCSLRWFYNADDPDIAESNRLSPGIPTFVMNEVYFSDHVESGASNSLEVLEGRAFVCSSKAEMVQFQKNPSHDYWEGDAIRFARCFYGYNAGNPPPIRELGNGELQLLLNNPSSDPDLYNRTRLSLYGPRGAVMKGTGTKKRIQSRLDASEEEGVREKDEISLRNLNTTASGFQKKQQYIGRPIRDNIDFGSSDDDSLPDKFKGKKTVRPEDMSPKVGEKSVSSRKKNKRSKNRKNRRDPSEPRTGNAHPRKSNSQKDIRRKSKSRKPERRQKVMHEKEAAAVDMQSAWKRVEESFEKGTKEQQEMVSQKLGDMFDLFLKTMEKNNLNFNLSERNKTSIAKIVAKTLFRDIPPAGTNILYP